MLSKVWKVIKILLLALVIYIGSAIIGALPFLPFGEKLVESYSEFLISPILVLFIYLNTKNLKETCKINKISFKLGFKSILIGFAQAFFSVLLIGFIIEVLQIKSQGLDANVTEYKSLMSSTMGLIILCLIGPITEEVLCRGFLLTKLRKVVNIKTAIIIQVIFFGFLHGNIIQFTDTFIMGLVAGCICYYTKSIFPSIIIHITNNTLASLNSTWIENHSGIVFAFGILFLFIGVYTLWSIIDEYKLKVKILKDVA